MKNNRIRRSAKQHKDDNNHFFGEKESQPANQPAQGAFFQPKLEIDPVDSPSEKEADAAAEQVVNRPGNQAQSTQSVQRKTIQRVEEEQPAAKRIQRMEEEQPAAKRIQRMEEEQPAAKRIQRVEEEQPAAKRIQRVEEEQPAAKRIQRVEEEQPAAKRIQRVEEEQPAAKRIQRMEEEQPAAKRIQRKEEGQKEGAQAVETMIQQSKGQGVPLPEDIRTEMENEFGANFSKVRIHTGADAIEMTQALQAHAFTHGYDIYFNEGRFDPVTKHGKELLAHELAHIIQQKGAEK